MIHAYITTSVVNICQSDKKKNDYYNTSSDQLHHEKFRNAHMTRVPRKCYRKVAYNKQKQTYIFIENNALVPLESSNYAILLLPTKQCLRYDHQTMQFSQGGWDECNWLSSYLLCQDVILHQSMGTNNNVRQMQTPEYANQTNRQGIHVPRVTPKDTYQNVKIRKDNKIWISVPDNYRDRSETRF